MWHVPQLSLRRNLRGLAEIWSPWRALSGNLAVFCLLFKKALGGELEGDQKGQQESDLFDGGLSFFSVIFRF